MKIKRTRRTLSESYLRLSNMWVARAALGSTKTGPGT
jgi:hypothetical protein